MNDTSTGKIFYVCILSFLSVPCAPLARACSHPRLCLHLEAARQFCPKLKPERIPKTTTEKMEQAFKWGRPGGPFREDSGRFQTA